MGSFELWQKKFWQAFLVDFTLFRRCQNGVYLRDILWAARWVSALHGSANVA